MFSKMILFDSSTDCLVLKNKIIAEVHKCGALMDISNRHVKPAATANDVICLE